MDGTAVNKLPDQKYVGRVQEKEDRRIEGDRLGLGQSHRSALKVGSSGGRRSNTKTVIRTAKTAPENALNRSGVAARSTAVSFTVCYRRFGSRDFKR